MKLLQRVWAVGSIFFAASSCAQAPVWTGSWAAAPMAAPATDAPISGDGATFRNFVHLSLGGKAIRIRLSNEYGTKPLTVDEVHVARSNGVGSITPGSDQALTFGGSRSLVISAGTVALSDSVNLALPAAADLAVTVYVPAQAEARLTYHADAISTNYIASGNQTGAAALQAATTSKHWYLVTGVDVDAGAKASAVVALGASVVNGTHSTDDKNLRWPDDLARRLQASPRTAMTAVLNEGIGGNRILHDNTGMSGIARLNRDVLSQSNATVMIFSMGTNDIGRSAFPVDKTEAPVTVEQMEWATRQVVWRAHARGMRIICATLNPYEGAAYYNDQGEVMRKAYNEFVRTSHACDGTVDFDRATLDPAHPSRFLPKYDSGDHLHPNDAGYQAMADAFDMGLFLH